MKFYWFHTLFEEYTDFHVIIFFWWFINTFTKLKAIDNKCICSWMCKYKKEKNLFCTVQRLTKFELSFLCGHFFLAEIVFTIFTVGQKKILFVTLVKKTGYLSDLGDHHYSIGWPRKRQHSHSTKTKHRNIHVTT